MLVLWQLLAFFFDESMFNVMVQIFNVLVKPSPHVGLLFVLFEVSDLRLCLFVVLAGRSPPRLRGEIAEQVTADVLALSVPDEQLASNSSFTEVQIFRNDVSQVPGTTLDILLDPIPDCLTWHASKGTSMQPFPDLVCPSVNRWSQET